MKKTTLLLSLLLIIFSFDVSAQAKNTKTTSSQQTKTSVKKTTTNKKVQVPAAKKDTTGYSNADKNEFMRTCAEQLPWSKDSATKYCSCMLAKIEKMYPNASDAAAIKEEDMLPLAKECIAQLKPGGSWSEAEKTKFNTQCIEVAAKKIDKQKATDYCSCMLVKLEKEYANAVDASKMAPEQLKTWAAECLGKEKTN